MGTQTIIKLRTHRDEIKKNLRGIKMSKYEGLKYGNEEEYVAKGIVAGIEAILIDISALTGATSKFIQRSTYAERTQLVQHLSSLSSHVSDKNLQQLALIIDDIKPVLRNIGIRHSNERKDVFDDHINDLQKNASDLSTHITDVAAIKSESSELKEEIDSLHQQLTEKLGSLKNQEETLVQLIAASTESREKLEGMLSNDQIRSENIKELLSTSKSHSEVIDGFSKKISVREAQLDDQEASTDQYKEKLQQFERSHEEYLAAADQLIEKSKLALEYTTAEGLSAAFTAQYVRANESGSNIGWLIAAGAFVVASVGIGIWVAFEQGLELPAVISRISLLPILIGGAWFSAGQYVKQKNIAEDYAYKSVLAKSIVGFSDQLATDSDKGPDYSHYMQSVLLQIHNDPLRKHALKPTEGNAATNDIRKALEEIKGLKKIVDSVEKMVKHNGA
jgi:hypothetical protein